MPEPLLSRRDWLLAAATLTVAGRHLTAHDLDTTWPTDPVVSAQISGVAVDAEGRALVLNRGENHWMPSGAFKRQKIRQPAVLVIEALTGRRVQRYRRRGGGDVPEERPPRP